MQMAHVGNFGKQFDAGKLLTAGPLGDNGFTRGIVVLAGNTPEQTAECFKPDPFVQNRILSIESHPWLIDVMQFGTAEVPFVITQHTLCVVKKGKNWKPTGTETNGDALLRLLPSLSAKARSGELALSGPFLDGGEKLGVMFFYSTNQAQLKADLASEPALAEGRVDLEFHPQYIGRGTLKNPAENLNPPTPGRTTGLFDGQSFAGWEGETNRTWRVQGGALVGGSLAETVPHNDFLCTKRPYRNFILRLKVKLTGTGFVNGGIQLRSQRLKDPAYEMSGYQADMGEGYWGSLYDESRRNKTLAHANALVVQHAVKPEQWNEYVIRCDGPHFRLWLNGVVTADYHEAEKDIPRDGYIGLQIHGGGKAEASYRDISIEELPDSN